MTHGSAAPAGPVATGVAGTAVTHPGRPPASRVLASATRWSGARVDLWPVALVAFLARGGLVVVALPFLVLPTPIGIAAWIGADAISADGPAMRLVVLAVVAGLLAGGAVVLGTVAAAAADRLVLAAWAVDAAATTARGRRTAATVARLVATRAVAAIPPLVALAWSIPRLADAVYRQLTLPDDLASPLVLRVVAMTPETVVAIAVGMVVGELIAGPAAVHVVVNGDGAVRALVRAPLDVVRRPAAVLGSFAAGTALLLVAVGLPLAAGIAAWGAVRRSLGGGADPLGAMVAVVAFVAALVVTLAAASAVAAWRRAAIAAAVGDPRRDPGRAATAR